MRALLPSLTLALALIGCTKPHEPIAVAATDSNAHALLSTATPPAAPTPDPTTEP